MTGTDPLLRITHLYHFTDRRNLPLIQQHGGLFPASDLARQGIKIPAPGGNQWSRDADEMSGMDRYVHLCFRATHPMEYAARLDGRIGDTIFLQIHPTVLQFEGVLFTPNVSNKSGVAPCAIADARDKIDFEVLYTRTDWSDPAIQKG